MPHDHMRLLRLPRPTPLGILRAVYLPAGHKACCIPGLAHWQLARVARRRGADFDGVLKRSGRVDAEVVRPVLALAQEPGRQRARTRRSFARWAT
eukprot:6186585-Pleurochrysis_carterae.AAC.7